MSRISNSNSSRLNDLLVSANNAEDDAVTTRERLRNKRKNEVRSLYYTTQPLREERDPARAVVNNLYHQQFDVAATVPLVSNLVHGQYYDAKEPIADLAKPHGLASRTRSQSAHCIAAQQRQAALPVPRPRPAPVEEPPRADGLCCEGEAAPSLKQTDRYMNPFPQDDTVDYWGRKKSRLPRRTVTERSDIFNPKETKVKRGLGKPNFSGSSNSSAASGWKKPDNIQALPSQGQREEKGDPATYARSLITPLPVTKDWERAKPIKPAPGSNVVAQQADDAPSRPATAPDSAATSQRAASVGPDHQSVPIPAANRPRSAIGAAPGMFRVDSLHPRDVPKMGHIDVEAVLRQPSNQQERANSACRRYKNRPMDSRFLF